MQLFVEDLGLTKNISFMIVYIFALSQPLTLHIQNKLINLKKLQFYTTIPTAAISVQPGANTLPPPHLQPKAKTSPGLLFGFIHTKVTWLLHLIRWFADFSASPLISVWSKNAVTAQQDRTCVHKSLIVALQLSGTASQRSLRCDFEGAAMKGFSQVNHMLLFFWVFFLP